VRTRSEVLLISGSLRARSTNSSALRTARALAPTEVSCVVYTDLAALPAFNPDDDRDPLPEPVTRLREAIHRADALLFSTPEYAGALPGAFKNLLDWCIGDAAERSISGKPVGWVNVSTRGAVKAHESLATVLGYAGAAVMADACVAAPFTEAAIDDEGLAGDAAVRESLGRVVAAVVAGDQAS
jgi:NAD(P)H-dependent FMN reductase